MRRWLLINPFDLHGVAMAHNTPINRLERQLERGSLLRWRFPDKAEHILNKLENGVESMADCPKDWRESFLDRIRVERIKIGDRRRWLLGERKGC